MGRRLVAAMAALLAMPANSFGNGRPPLTVGVHFRPGDPHSIYAASTFGLLISHDDGCTFQWVCEASVGYGGIFDPLYAIAADGTIFATTYTGLRISRDDGCTFTQGSPTIALGALDIGPTGDVWIATADGSQPNQLLVSTDNGQSFTPRGSSLSPQIQWNGLEVAPSDPQRVYATGVESATTTHLYTSTDAGGTWTPSSLTGVTFGGAPVVRVLAVDPANADVVYVASGLGANPPNGDRLYRSSDAGMTLTEVLATVEPIHDVVIQDAQHVLVATSVGGFASTDGGVTFAPLASGPQLQCVGARADGTLLGCGTNWDPDFMSLATSSDGGVTWQNLWRFTNIAGPVACAAGTPQHDSCDVEQWPVLSAQFGATGPTCGDHIWPGEAPPPSSGGCCDVGGDAGVSLGWTLGIALWLGRRRRQGAVTP